MPQRYNNKHTVMLSMFDPISRGAAMTAHRLNCVRDCSGVLYTAAAGLDPTNMSGSFQLPGLAYLESSWLILRHVIISLMINNHKF